MKVIKIILIILGIIFIFKIYNTGKEHGESAVISDSVNDIINPNVDRIGDIDEIKKRLENNEF